MDMKLVFSVFVPSIDHFDLVLMIPYRVIFCKSSGNIGSHRTGPEEERKIGVVNDVAENFTQVGADERVFVIDTEAFGDAECEVADEGVNEESDCQY